MFDPGVQFAKVDVHFGRLRQIRAKGTGLFQIDVRDFFLRFFRIPMQHDANAQRQRVGNVDFVPAQQRHIPLTKLSGGYGGELRIEIARHGECGAGDILRSDPIFANHHR